MGKIGGCQLQDNFSKVIVQWLITLYEHKVVLQTTVFLKQEKYFFKTSQGPVIQVKQKVAYTLLAF